MGSCPLREVWWRLCVSPRPGPGSCSWRSSGRKSAGIWKSCRRPGLPPTFCPGSPTPADLWWGNLLTISLIYQSGRTIWFTRSDLEKKVLDSQSVFVFWWCKFLKIPTFEKGRICRTSKKKHMVLLIAKFYILNQFFFSVGGVNWKRQNLSDPLWLVWMWPLILSIEGGNTTKFPKLWMFLNYICGEIYNFNANSKTSTRCCQLFSTFQVIWSKKSDIVKRSWDTQWFQVPSGIRQETEQLQQTGPPRCRGLFRGIASPAVLGHKEPARASKAPY